MARVDNQQWQDTRPAEGGLVGSLIAVFRNVGGRAFSFEIDAHSSSIFRELLLCNECSVFTNSSCIVHGKIMRSAPHRQFTELCVIHARAKRGARRELQFGDSDAMYWNPRVVFSTEKVVFDVSWLYNACTSFISPGRAAACQSSITCPCTMYWSCTNC